MINQNKNLNLREKDKRGKITIAILLLIAIIGVGYAALGANLKINGVANIPSASWDVHFKTGSISVTEGSVTGTNVTTAAVITNATQVDYAVKLALPGDFYEFTVVAENTGTIDAMIDSVVSKLGDTVITTGTLPSYIDYSVTYGDGTEIAPHHLLAKNTEETYKVRIAYKTDIEANQLPKTAETLNLNFQANYVQADNTAIQHTTSGTQPKVPVTETIYWALQDNNNDGNYEKLVISDHEVTGSDNYQGSFAGTTVFSQFAEVPWNLNSGGYGGNSSNVEEVKIEGTVAPASTAYWFHGLGEYSESFEGNFNDLNVSNVTNMVWMFYCAGSNATTWNIGDLSGWDTSNVTDMSNMFDYAGSHATTWNIGDLSGWDTSKVTDMSWMFSGAGLSARTFELDLSGWDTSQVTNMSGMFSITAAAHNATTFNLNLSGWDTSKVTDMSNMFYNAGEYATTWNVIIPSTNGGEIRNTTSSLYGKTTSNYASPNNGKQFILDGQENDTNSNIQPKVPITDTIYWALQDNNNDGNYEKLVISDQEVTGSDGYQGNFAGTASFDEYDVPWRQGGSDYGGISTKVEEVKIEGTVAPTSTAYWFEGIGQTSQTLEGNFNDLNVSNVTNMKGMFYFSGLDTNTYSLNLSGWDISKVTDMSEMFYYAGSDAKIFRLNLSGWNTSNVTNMSSMFYNAGDDAETWSVTIPSTNGGGISNDTTHLYGIDTSTYGYPDYEREFTLA